MFRLINLQYLNSTSMRNRSRSRNQNVSRRGIEVVELAIIMPLLLLLTFGTLEICEGIFLRQKLELAAHEGVRVAIRKNATIEDVEVAVQRNLDARGIVYRNISSAVEITPDPTLAPTLTPVTVRVTIVTNPNLRMSLSLYEYLVGKSINGEVSMLKEYEK